MGDLIGDFVGVLLGLADGAFVGEVLGFTDGNSGGDLAFTKNQTEQDLPAYHDCGMQSLCSAFLSHYHLVP